MCSRMQKAEGICSLLTATFESNYTAMQDSTFSKKLPFGMFPNTRNSSVAGIGFHF